MPLYEYLCVNNHFFSRFSTVANHSPIEVCECGEVAQQIIGAPAMVKCAPDVCYDSPIDGSPITSWAKREEDLKRHDCRPYDEGMKQDYLRSQEESQKSLDKSIEQHVERSIEKMDTKTRGKLYSELTEQHLAADIRR